MRVEVWKVRVVVLFGRRRDELENQSVSTTSLELKA